jgi:hypothetical protein
VFAPHDPFEAAQSSRAGDKQLDVIIVRFAGWEGRAGIGGKDRAVLAVENDVKGHRIQEFC